MCLIRWTNSYLTILSEVGMPRRPLFETHLSAQKQTVADSQFGHQYEWFSVRLLLEVSKEELVMFIYCGRAAFQTIIGKLLRKLIFVRNIKTTLGCCWHAHVLRVLELCLAAAGWLLQNRRNEFEKYQFSTYVYKQIADRSRRAG